MSQPLPLFPLNIVVFPGETLNLHIFEDKYKQLIKDCLDTKSNFGVPFHAGGVKELGTEIKIESLEKAYDNGEMDISTMGSRVFRIREYCPQQDNKMYACAEVDFLDDDSSEDQTVRTKILDIYKQLIAILVPASPIKQKDNRFLSYKIGHHLAMSKEQEYEMLSLRNESLRQLYILNHLQLVLPLALEIENLKERIIQNGHFRALSVE